MKIILPTILHCNFSFQINAKGV